MKKPIPRFQTDEQAEIFVATADLAEYDLSGGEVVHFELRPKDDGALSDKPTIVP